MGEKPLFFGEFYLISVSVFMNKHLIMQNSYLLVNLYKVSFKKHFTWIHQKLSFSEERSRPSANNNNLPTVPWSEALSWWQVLLLTLLLVFIIILIVLCSLHLQRSTVRCLLCLKSITSKAWPDHRLECGAEHAESLSRLTIHPSLQCRGCKGDLRLWTTKLLGKWKCSSGLCGNRKTTSQKR